MNMPDVERILVGLKGFQRDAVEHIIDRLYRAPSSSGRFLVADETGLGKSVIARGVIASAIAELQDAAHIDRIDVVYICSSTDLAKQNLRRLNVTGDPHLGVTSRLTMLALETRHLASDSTLSGKKVNLVSFTPGTSFEMGWQTGSQQERQLLHILLNGMEVGDAESERASALFFQGGVASVDRFQAGIAGMRATLGRRAGSSDPARVHRSHPSTAVCASSSTTSAISCAGLTCSPPETAARGERPHARPTWSTRRRRASSRSSQTS